MAHPLQEGSQSVEEPSMNLRSLFRVSPGQTVQAKPEPQRVPTLIDVDVEYVDEPQPRGRSFETWTRARGWASED